MAGRLLRRMRGLPHHHRFRRARRLALAAALCAVAALLGSSTAHASSFSFETPSIQVTVSPTSATTGQDVTLTAVVTATSAYPDGTVKFATLADPVDGIGGSAIPLKQVSALQSKATVTTSFPQGTYAIVAYFTPTAAESSSFTFFPADTTADPQVLTVSSSLPGAATTHATLEVSPLPVVQGQHESLTAHVTADSGPTPTGGQVIFSDGNQQIGVADLVDGVATVSDVGSFGAGPHELTAAYQGNDPLFAPSVSATYSFTVADTAPPPTTTQTALAVTPSTIHQGDTVDLVAHVTQAGGALAPPGDLVYFYSSSDCLNGALGSAPIDAGGDATLSDVGSWAAASYTLCASYVGNTFRNLDTSVGTAPLRVLAPVSQTGATATTLRYTGPTTGDYGDSVELSALLQDSAGNGVDGRQVTLTLGTQSCDATTASDGTASCPVTISQPVGAVTAAADFAGNGDYLASDDPGVLFTVTKEEATLALSAPATVVFGDTVTLTATLREDGSTPISGRAVDFVLGSATCSGSTDSSGIATCAFPATGGSGATAASASFAGDTTYARTSDQRSVTVQLQTTLSFTGPASADYGDAATLTAHLADQLGHAVANARVTFTLGAQTCTASTGSNGDVTCPIAPNEAAGAVPLHVGYAGSGDGVYLASSADPSFTVTAEETTLALTAPADAQQGSTITLTATLLEDGTTPVVDGRAVTFTYGGATCTAPTSGGVATCQVPAAALGPLTVGAAFTSDGYYAAATTQARTVYVYASTPGGGLFVVGDGSAAGTVSFWGDQWWKANTLSGGSAPSSFKGYALNASTTCGGTWSTDPGNSIPPPAGPLPAYIAVVVASSATKSGAAITGDELHVVVVRTAPGYDGNPGHSGTGAVVATIC